MALLLGLGAGIVGLGLIAAAYQSNEQRRETFLSQLAAGLRARGLEYVSATFGRAAGNLPVWNVTFNAPLYGVQSLRVVLSAEMQPYADATCAAVIEYIAAAVPS